MARWLSVLALFSFSLQYSPSPAANQQPLSGDFSQLSNLAYSVTQGDNPSNNGCWDLNKGLTDNTTANLVFSTASSLLQSIPNQRYRNGHTIVPAIVQSGAILYHGRGDAEVPTMDWVAFEPEVSQYFCRTFGGPSKHCWFHTFVVDRPLRVLYFDGAAVALGALSRGSMDSQDIFAWGELRPDMALEEGLRIRQMCKRALRLGLDGFIRTGVISEIMLCDFGSIKLVSSRHLKSASTTPVSVSSTTGEIPLYTEPISLEVIQVLRLLRRFEHYPGLGYVRLDLTHLVSFYDTKLAPSLIAPRSGKHRLGHRLFGINKEDTLRMRKYLEEQIVETPWSSLQAVENTVDWPTYLHWIINLNGENLEDIRLVLSGTQSNTRPSNQREQAKNAFRLIEDIVQRFILYSVSPGENSSDLAWASPVFRECALSHSLPISTISLTTSEALLRDAAEGTTRELCRVLTKMWATGVREGLSSLFNTTVAQPNSLSWSVLLDIWKQELGNLMDWLDWNIWIRCKPACREQELCYIPTWPISIGNVSLPVWREDDPQPRCLRTVPPYIYADDY
ncbi:hypothetical protein J3R30DRAFT_756745 [Lentinula aciculospora]|uniref:Uncharacterized protein n=1 Tax=Lentinula aciculospora TaxID=153920 RepID=A0A9W9A2M3_9AGAR|nr:hypothetical protein J3R30DRAFT_756745 [Lentinula aciculospora]